MSKYQIEHLMREYGNDVLRTAYSYVHDQYIAEDLFQEVFIKIHNNLDGFLEESAIRTWIIKITINTCKDYIKSSYHRHVIPVEIIENRDLNSDSGYLKAEEWDRNLQIKQAVMELPIKYREPILCVYYHELKLEETSRILGIPEGTLKSRLSRARKRLRLILERRL